MDFNSYMHFDSVEDYSNHWNRVFDAVISKVQSGAKRLLIALPPGGGKTKMLIQIAETIENSEGANSLFIVANKFSAIQLKQMIQNTLPKAEVKTFFELNKENFITLSERKYVFNDGLRILDRRMLMGQLKNYQGLVVSMWDPNQEVQHG